MGQFIDILMDFEEMTGNSSEDSEELTKWLGLLAHFNRSQKLPKHFTQTYEEYFNYYWKNDRNQAINCP